MSLMSNEKFNEFFAPYAERVDGFYEVRYWELSDAVIRELIRTHLSPEPGSHIVDIGGGTGRWAEWLAKEFNVNVTILDKSTSMLEAAAKKLHKSPVESMIRLVNMDVEDVTTMGGQEFDAAISTYGVLSFLENPDLAFRSIATLLKPGAQALLMSHSYSNALASKINRDNSSLDEITSLAHTKIVKWNAEVPPLRVYTSKDLKELAKSAGMIPERLFGVTSVFYPGPEDFGYPYSAVSNVSQRLEDPEYFARALEIELAACEDDDWAERGVNLMLKVRNP